MRVRLLLLVCSLCTCHEQVVQATCPRTQGSSFDKHYYVEDAVGNLFHHVSGAAYQHVKARGRMRPPNPLEIFMMLLLKRTPTAGWCRFGAGLNCTQFQKNTKNLRVCRSPPMNYEDTLAPDFSDEAPEGLQLTESVAGLGAQGVDKRSDCGVGFAPDQVFVINLEKDVKRLAKITTRLKSEGLGTFIHKNLAVNGKKLCRAELRRCSTGLARIFSTLGMIGCFLSHVECWRRTRDAGKNVNGDRGHSGYSLVFEDDVVLASNFKTKAAEIITELDSNDETKGKWDVVLLGALGCVHPDGNYGVNVVNSIISGGERKARRITPHVFVPHRPYGCHAYLISQQGACKLMNKASIASWHVDGVAWGIKDLNLYCAHPLLAYQEFVEPSTLGATTRGFEAWLPRIILDTYTKVTLQWTFNEPIIKLGSIPVTMTQGRCLGLILFGFILSALTGSRSFLFSHATISALMCGLVRILCRPAGAIAKKASLVSVAAATALIIFFFGHCFWMLRQFVGLFR